MYFSQLTNNFGLVSRGQTNKNGLSARPTNYRLWLRSISESFIVNYNADSILDALLRLFDDRKSSLRVLEDDFSANRSSRTIAPRCRGARALH